MPDTQGLSPSLDGYAAQGGRAVGEMVSVLWQMDPVGLFLLVLAGWFVGKAFLRVLGLLFVLGGLVERHVVVVRERRELDDAMPVRSSDPW